MPMTLAAKPRLTTKLLTTLWARREQGERTVLLAHEIQRSAQMLRQYWRRFGFYSSRVIRTRENKRCAPARIYALRLSGTSYLAIAAELGLPPEERTVRMLYNRLSRYCLRVGVPMPHPNRRTKPTAMENAHE
jgi:hypothetical protein